MQARIAKTALVAAVGLYLALVVFNNLTDYGSNFAFVQHVLAMDTTFPGNGGMWRALNAPWIAHAFFASIILWEAAACLMTLLGAWRMWQRRGDAAASFNQTKQLAIAGLSLNLLQWLVAFIAIGGEWFLMWQSSTWNGSDAAGRMFAVVGIILLFVNAKDEDLLA
jgi:predicted small integral membrane protein